MDDRVCATLMPIHITRCKCVYILCCGCSLPFVVLCWPFALINSFIILADSFARSAIRHIKDRNHVVRVCERERETVSFQKVNSWIENVFCMCSAAYDPLRLWKTSFVHRGKLLLTRISRMSEIRFSAAGIQIQFGRKELLFWWIFYLQKKKTITKSIRVSNFSFSYVRLPLSDAVDLIISQIIFALRRNFNCARNGFYFYTCTICIEFRIDGLDVE